ncbi:MAG: hypothetical protein ACK47C_19085 [Paracoccaceae bacterium]
MAWPMPFRSLDPAKILATAETLERRVRERFPDRGLALVAAEVVALARMVTAEVGILTPPIWWLRGLVALVVAVGAAVFLWVGSIVPLRDIGQEAVGSVQGIEAAINTLLLAGFGMVALVRLEARVKRQRVARGLHGLRSIIHVIDMHQLTKDPVTLSPDFSPTETSPARDLDAVGMSRYLDYCSELLALTGKLAALYSQAVPDEGVAQAVTDIELLGASLSRKIWQKISLIEPKSQPRRKRVPE